MSEAVKVGLIFVLLGAALMFLYCIIGTLIGLVVGWVISITPLGSFVENGLSALGFDAKGHLLDIGAALGFVSGIIGGATHRYSSEEKKDDRLYSNRVTRKRGSG